MKGIYITIASTLLGCLLFISGAHSQFANCADDCRAQLKNCREACKPLFFTKKKYNKCSDDCDDAWRECRKKCN